MKNNAIPFFEDNSIKMKQMLPTSDFSFKFHDNDILYDNQCYVGTLDWERLNNNLYGKKSGSVNKSI